MHPLATRAAMAWQRYVTWRPLERMSHDPEAAQAAVLRRLTGANRDTTFGRRHGFVDIASHQVWVTRVPPQQHDTLAPHIERQRRTGETALSAEAPSFYAQTSGTSGTPKYIPVTPTMLRYHRDEQAAFSYLQYRACPAAYEGRAFGVMGAAVEDRLDSGHVVGSISGHLYSALPRAVRSRLVVPPEVAAIPDYDRRYQVLALLALAAPDVTYAGSPNPSTFVRLLEVLNANRDTLLPALAAGRSTLVDSLPSAAGAAVVARLRPDPERARQLARLPAIGYDMLWPQLALLTTWTGGSCGIPLAALRSRLPRATRVMELGYQATECRGTLPLEAEVPSGLPPLNHHYFEFARPSSWDTGNTTVVPLADLELGRQYYVLVSTAAGLYRYFMNDLVEVTGVFNRTPLLRFVQKGRGVTNVTGEKLYEGQAIAAVKAGCDAHGAVPAFFLLAAIEDPAGYRLYLETASAGSGPLATLASSIDRLLGELNIEYAAKRQSGRLRPLEVVRLRAGAADAYRTACVGAGQREGQLKPPALAYRRTLLADLDAYAATPGEAA
ncbi:MAG TPA: GH3 auxin-responsive promoter family protein [Vicinamibacterales bacterium]